MRNRISNRIINLVISLLVATMDSVRNLLAGLVGHPPRKTCVVFVYHSVPAAQQIRFARQMDVVIRHAQPVPADIAALQKGEKNYAATTFDDGIENVNENALPELQKRTIPVTIFVVNDMLGGNKSSQMLQSKWLCLVLHI